MKIPGRVLLLGQRRGKSTGDGQLHKAKQSQMKRDKHKFSIKKILKKCLTNDGRGGNICKSPVIRRLNKAETKENL